MQNNQLQLKRKSSQKLPPLTQSNQKRPWTIVTNNSQKQQPKKQQNNLESNNQKSLKKCEFQIIQQPQQKIESLFQQYIFYGKQIAKRQFQIHCPSASIRLNGVTEFQTLKTYDNIVLYEKQPQIGKLYQVKYDANNNPTFLIVEGEFSWQNDSREIQVVKQSIKYIGKSNIPSKDNEINQVKENDIKFQESSALLKRIKIYDEGGVLQNVKPLIVKSYFPQTWIKCNQQICENDIRIFSTCSSTILQQNSRQWVTSSIIDSYALLLNIQSSKEYFLKPSSERSKIDRLLIVNSTVFTSFFQVEKNFEVTDQHLEVFKKEFLEYQEIEFQIWNIFKKIAFVINQNNFHWFLILIDFSSKKTIISIYDSLGKNKKWYEGYCMYFKKFFAKLEFQCEFESEIAEQNIYQNDGYSCGYHTCSNMKFLREKQFYKDAKNKYDEKEMKDILKQLLQRQ